MGHECGANLVGVAVVAKEINTTKIKLDVVNMLILESKVSWTILKAIQYIFLLAYL